MTHKRRSNPHFFKVLIPGFLSNFCIPKSFLKHLGLEESTDGNDFVAVLKDSSWSPCNGKDRSWFVQVDSDGRRFLNGWKEFADDHGLRVGEFLVFNHLGGFVFDVLVFDPVSASRRSFSTEKTGYVESKGKKGTPSKRIPFETSGNPTEKTGYVRSKGKKGTPSKRRVTFENSGNPYFRATVRKYCIQWRGMFIPVSFARDNDLVGRLCEMIIMDEKDRSWPVTLKCRTGRNEDQLYISSGWGALADANGLKIGDSVVYELVDSGSLPVMKFYKES